MNSIMIGGVYLWISSRGYSADGGERAEVYNLDYATQRACINVAGDEQCPEGYSYSVSFDELHDLNEVLA